MSVFLAISFGLLVWLLLGAFVLQHIDRDEELYTWYAAAPYAMVKVAFMLLWPVVAVVYLRGRSSKGEK